MGWIEGPVGDLEDPHRPPQTEYQLVALTYTGGWYRLSLPFSAGTPAAMSSGPGTIPSSPSPPSIRALSFSRPRSPSEASTVSRTERGKGKEPEKEGKESRACILREFRRYGRWDGWG